MKKQYIITTGDYEDYRIVAVIEGDERPSLMTLNRRFEQQFGGATTTGSARANAAKPLTERIRERIQLEHRIGESLAAAGYSQDIGSGFVEWLCKEHGFTRVDIGEFRV